MEYSWISTAYFVHTVSGPMQDQAKQRILSRRRLGNRHLHWAGRARNLIVQPASVAETGSQGVGVGALEIEQCRWLVIAG